MSIFDGALCFLWCSDEVIRLLAAYTGPEGFQVASDEYFSKWGASPSQETIQRAAVEIGTDYNFLVSTQVALYLHAAKTTWGNSHFWIQDCEVLSFVIY